MSPARDESLHPHLSLCLSCSLGLRLSLQQGFSTRAVGGQGWPPDIGVAMASPVHSRVSGFGERRLAATWLGAQALVGLTTEAGVLPWGLELGTSCPLCNLGSHGLKQSPVTARPPQLAAESRSPRVRPSTQVQA